MKRISSRIPDFMLMLIFGLGCICFCYLWYVGELDIGLPMKILWLFLYGSWTISYGIDAFKDDKSTDCYMKNKFNKIKISEIIQYEEEQKIIISKLVEELKQSIKQYDCDVRLEFLWGDDVSVKDYYKRLPIEDGYYHYVRFIITHHKKHLFECEEPYEYLTYSITQIRKPLFHSNVYVYFFVDPISIKKYIDELENLVIKEAKERKWGIYNTKK